MKILRRLQAWFRRERLDTEVAEEMRAHLALLTEKNLAAGLSRDDARAAAERSFGNVAGLQQRVREARFGLWLEQFQQDVRFSARSLARNPGFSFAAVAILALGIGASTALFSVIYGVLLEPYPYARSNEIWAPTVANQKTGRWVGLRMSDYLEIARLPGVQIAMATAPEAAFVSGDPFPDLVAGARLTATAFEFLEVPPVLGRGFTPADVMPGGEPRPVTVLSYQLWQTRFNGDTAIVGQTILIGDVPHVVLGVMPPRFGWYGNDGLWRPLAETDLKRGVNPIIRLKPGVSPASVEDQLRALFNRLAKEEPQRFPAEGFTVHLFNYLDVTVASGSMRTSLLALVAAVGLLLLIACANVANLLFARGAIRAREIAVRVAVGATRGRLLRQLLTESVALSLAGGILGVALAYGLIQLIVVLLPPAAVPNEARVTINLPVLGFAVGLAGLTGILAGLAPGWQGARVDPNHALKDGGLGVAGGGRSARTRQGLVVGSVALSVVLLVGASLAIRGFTALFQHDWGFRPEKLLMLRVPLPVQRYTTTAQRHQFAERLLERARLLPGVRAVAFGDLPFNNGARVPFRIPEAPNAPVKETGGSLVSADFRATFGLHLLAGRDFTEAEVARGEAVALISETTARLWPAGIDPIGRLIEMDALADAGSPSNLAPANPVKALTVIGIVNDTRNANLRADPPPAVYVPYTLRGLSNVTFLVRTDGPPMNLLPLLRSEVRALDKSLPLRRPITVEEIMGQQTVQPRFNMTLFSGLAALALLLAASGLYSLLAFNVVQRTREIGVRMALGADRAAVLGLVLKSGATLVALGLGLGLAASFALVLISQSEIFSVPGLVPGDFAGAALALGLAGGAACLLPALRATKVDPMIALRAE